MTIGAPLPEKYCSIHSLNNREPLIGSASRTDYWILLEYPHPMSQKALRDNLLPDEIKTYLARLQTSLANSRVLLIRQHNPTNDSPIMLYLADGRDGSGLLYRLPLSRYTDMLEVDIPSIFDRGSLSQYTSPIKHLLLVCTNGKRDACCSKWGLPLYEALERQYAGQVWQSSHLGGHRFAPNLVCIPHGVFYGRVPLVEATSVVERYLSGRITLDFLRGTAAYAPPIQAAEYFLRRETSDDRVGIYRLENFTPVSENQWEISFIDEQTRDIYHLKIETFKTEREIFESCSTPSEMKAVWEYRLSQPILLS
jgi:hypothetical protein